MTDPAAELRKLERSLWSQVAYACRYGKQPLQQVLSLSPAGLDRFKKALAAIVTEESK